MGFLAGVIIGLAIGGLAAAVHHLLRKAQTAE
jgi:hypothetical protein